MRRHSLGLKAREALRTPRFKAEPKKKAEAAEDGRKNTPVMSYFPAIKGAPRMERLRHWFHIDMACLLDARPSVVSWTAEAPALPEVDGEKGFAPDFLFSDGRGEFAVRLLRGSLKSPSKHLDAIADEYAARGISFVVTSKSELEAEPDLRAAKLLFTERQRAWPEELPRLLELAHDCDPTTLGELHGELGGGLEEWHWLLSLAAHGHLAIDLAWPIGPATTVRACRAKGYRS